MYTVTPKTVTGLLLFYAALFVIVRTYKPSIQREEKRTFLTIASLWAVLVFIANFALYKAGFMSFLPWVNNFMHTFLWIGIGLAFLYLGVRERQNMFVQFVLFATFSLIVKYAEHLLFGTWDHDHFFHVFRGNFAYIMGWSLADGLYPPITLYGLRLLGKWIPGLIVL